MSSVSFSRALGRTGINLPGGRQRAVGLRENLGNGSVCLTKDPVL